MSSDMPIADNLESAIKQSWSKIAADSKKAGYRDGVSDGRDSNFQAAFDVGYKEGFKNGFLIGTQKGTLTGKGELSGVKEEILRHSKRGWCQICENNSTSHGNISEIIKNQDEHCIKEMRKVSE